MTEKQVGRTVAIATGAVIGALPGAMLVSLTVPVSGEAELTLGVVGIALAALGAAMGVIVLTARASGRRG